eukprot:scaffold36530_cov35-Phaeocystis_antarctica.AAC.5
MGAILVTISLPPSSASASASQLRQRCTSTCTNAEGGIAQARDAAPSLTPRLALGGLLANDDASAGQ